MSKLKRYEEYKHDNGLYEDGFGEWVKYEDVKELEAKIAELEASKEETHYTKHPDLGLSRDMLLNKITLLQEDIECPHMWLDEFDIPREDGPDTYSIVGRCKLYIEKLGIVNQESEWVNCEDGMPENFVNVLLRIKVCDKFNVQQGYFNGDSEWVDCWCRGLDSYEVSHWMPLPTPPKDKG